MFDLNQKRIFLVDDTPDNLAILQETLGGEGYKFAFASSGEEALEHIPEINPDLILLDVMMPGINGFETCRRIKQDESLKDIPIIFITAKNESSDVTQGFKIGGVDYIKKPFRQEEVRARVRSHLELNELRKHLEQKVVERTEELNNSRLDFIRRLGMAGEFKDNETGMHVVRMSHYSSMLAKAAGQNEHYCELMLQSSPMHDIGKIGIPDKILLKPGKLDSSEWEIMKSHVDMGASLLAGEDCDLIQMARIVALNHHEKWNGAGYPNGLKGEEIPLEGRIVAIADVFDALTSDRPYKKEWPVAEAISLIEREAGTHFDPKLVPVFKSILPGIVKVKEEFPDSDSEINLDLEVGRTNGNL